MAHGARVLAHRGATALGFGLLVPGVVTLMWCYSAAAGVTLELHTAAVALSIGGAASLLVAIGLGLGHHLQRAGRTRLAPPAQRASVASTPPARDDRVTELHPIPSYRTVMADAPGAIWTVPRTTRPEGELATPLPTPPPLYDSLVAGGVGSESEGADRMAGPGAEPRYDLEPLTPPPNYEQIQRGQVFDFEPRGDAE